jgi:nucleotidyltransferase/DNA polymerase involved in DNA repair
MDVTRCQAESEALLQLLEHIASEVEPHGWGAAYVNLSGLARNYSEAAILCRKVGRAIRQEMGADLQPALGWNSSKFTARAATAPGRWPGDRVQPGYFRVVTTPQEQGFLQPLPVTLLPLPEKVLQRLCFLGLRTLGQYAELPPAAVWQQFGRAGKLAQRCARGKDDRPITPRWRMPHLAAEVEFETPLVDREQLLAELGRLVSPLLAKLQGNLQACRKLRLTAQFDDGSIQEKTRTFLLPIAKDGRILRALGKLLEGLDPSPQRRYYDYDADSIEGTTGTVVAISSLAVALEQIQDTVAEQLTLFPLEGMGHRSAGTKKLQQVQRYLTARFAPSKYGGSPPSCGGPYLQRAVLSQPDAPLPEWRVDWLAEDAQ